MLSERLEQAWRERQRSNPIEPELRLSEKGLALGAGTVLAPTNMEGLTETNSRLAVLMTVAHLRTPSANALAHLLKATRRWNEGDEAMAHMHLALSGLGRLQHPETDARRLFLAEALLDAGLTPELLHKAFTRQPLDPGLAKYSPDQPRVPAGNGRPSGRWTSSGATPGAPAARRPERAYGGTRASSPQTAAPSDVQPSVTKPPGSSGNPPGARLKPGSVPTAASLVGVAAAGGEIGPAADLGKLTIRQLRAVAAFVAALAPTTALGMTAAVAGGLGLAFIPSAGPTGRWVRVPGPGNISYFQSPDVPGLLFRYTTADGKQEELRVGPGPGGEYRDPRTGKVFARWVKTGGKVGLLIATDALLMNKDENGRLCPSPEEERHGPRGREYEDFVKKVFNQPPTPSGFGYGFLNSTTNKRVVFDDCQRQSGALAEYKGKQYEEFLLDHKYPYMWNGAFNQMIEQAQRQEAARDGRPIIWFFDSKIVKDFVQNAFEKRFPDIQFVWLPMPREKK